MDDRHLFPPDSLAALVGSRLCHDLVNPLGAIGNGVELLGMTGAVSGPEMELIAEAVRDAQARIRFFRIAFGAASESQTISAREAREILDGLYSGTRFSVSWEPDNDTPRGEVKLAFLMLSCAEAALPMGGDVRIARSDAGRWTLEAIAGRVRVEPDLWTLLVDPVRPGALRPAEVQFLLLSTEAATQGRALRHALGDTTVRISTD